LAATAKLAATGSDLMNPPWLAITLFGLGGGALLVSRRRKTQPHS
jgi:LPXTG-motif cell wall-anchored protein